MFGINGAEVLVLLLVALVVVGPERLPAYAEQLGAWTRRLRELVGTAKQRVSAELGEDSDVDWASGPSGVIIVSLASGIRSPT